VFIVIKVYKVPRTFELPVTSKKSPRLEP